MHVLVPCARLSEWFDWPGHWGCLLHKLKRGTRWHMVHWIHWTVGILSNLSSRHWYSSNWNGSGWSRWSSWPRWSRCSGWSKGSGWSGDQVIRAVKVFMMARVVQTVPAVPMIQVIRLVQMVRWSGTKSGLPGWYAFRKSSNTWEKLRCHACDGRTDLKKCSILYEQNQQYFLALSLYCLSV